jgi:superoxide dismutase
VCVLFRARRTHAHTRTHTHTHTFFLCEKDFGGIEKLEAIFKDKATKLFGSGWTWLVVKKEKKKKSDKVGEAC